MPRESTLDLRRAPDGVDLVALFRSLATRYEDLFWLDAGDGASEGWSIVGIGEVDAVGPAHVRVDAAVRRGADMPPFQGGWVGWLDFESGARAAGAPVEEDEGGPAWMRVTAAVAVEHATGAVWEMGERSVLLPAGTNPSTGSGPVPPLPVLPSLPVVPSLPVLPPLPVAPSLPVLPPLPVAEPVEAPGTPRSASARHTPAEYAALIDRCRDAIRAGDAYQLCLTTRFSVSGAHDEIAAYLRLRTATPAHHGGFVRIGGRSLLSASPETFLHVAGGVIRTRPIKGTRPRGVDRASDAALADELLASPKERAENVMIVDLMRNDLSRVCEPGSIRVEGLWQIESYPAVHQLVSTVSGRAAPGLTVQDLWNAAFPAGSMTGAPKLSAMTLLHGFESGAPRGVYSGCFGYVGADGGVDLAMVIRSILIDQNLAVVGAGGGITWGSIAQDEVDEVATKARAPLAALGADLPASWRFRAEPQRDDDPIS